jgi:hypothetical protein
MEFSTSCILVPSKKNLKTATKDLHDRAFDSKSLSSNISADPAARSEEIKGGDGRIERYVNLTPDEAYVLDQHTSQNIETTFEKHEFGGLHYDEKPIPRLKESLYKSIELDALTKNVRAQLGSKYEEYFGQVPDERTPISQLVDRLDKLRNRLKDQAQIQEITALIEMVAGYQPKPVQVQQPAQV